MSDDPKDCPVTPWRENHVLPAARAAALARDGGVCVRCGGTGSRIEVNHITPRWGDQTQTSCIHHLDGLETLCRECHHVATRDQWRARREALKPSPDWRPRKLWAASDIAEYLCVSRSTVHNYAARLPEPFGILNEGGARETRVWASVDVIAWAKENGWVPYDDPREGVDPDDPDYDPWAGGRYYGRRSHRSPRPAYESEAS